MTEFPSASGQAPSRTSYDAELRRHNEVLRLAVDVHHGDHIVDIGCGTGQTTRDAARKASPASALGIDVSAQAIRRARELARGERVRNVAFETADAQTYRFPQAHFDAAISRFGTMFFHDPIDAFTNIGRGLRPAGRLTMMVWQAPELNEWDVTIRRALGSGSRATGPTPSKGQDAFSLADPPTVKRILEAAGYAEVGFTDVDEPVYYGPDVDAALEWVCRFKSSTEVLDGLDPAAATDAVQRLREAIKPHLSAEGVWFNSRSWIVTARRH